MFRQCSHCNCQPSDLHIVLLVKRIFPGASMSKTWQHTWQCHGPSLVMPCLHGSTCVSVVMFCVGKSWFAFILTPPSVGHASTCFVFPWVTEDTESLGHWLRWILGDIGVGNLHQLYRSEPYLFVFFTFKIKTLFVFFFTFEIKRFDDYLKGYSFI